MDFSFLRATMTWLIATTPGLLLTSTPLFLTGYAYLKRWGEEQTAILAVTAFAFLAAAHAIYGLLIAKGLSQGQLASSVACLLGGQALAVFLFNENFSVRSGIAVACVLTASIVLAWPEGGRG
ncbi:MAG: hypothetical protein AAGC95_02775 [Pseudomonadota bacterium]